MAQADAGDLDRFGLVGARFEGRIRIDRVEASSAAGVVYQGHHLALGRPVAVKLRAIAGDAGALHLAHERFLADARVASRISHPAVVRVMDFGLAETPTSGLAPFLVLEWLDGVTLSQFVTDAQRLTPWTPDEVVSLLRPVFEAVDAAHAQGVAHLALSPSRVMRVAGPSGPSLRLLDFGVARDVASGLSSLEFAAPEQAAREATGPWTDVHALGLLMTYLLTRTAPYGPGGGATSPARPTPALRGRDLGAWEPIIARALSLRPDGRYASAGEFLMALELALPRARPGGTGSYPVHRVQVLAAAPSPVAARRGRRAGVWAAALAILVGVVALTGAAWSRRARSPSPAEHPAEATLAPSAHPAPRTHRPTRYIPARNRTFSAQMPQ